MLGAGAALADDPYRIVLGGVDASDFPTVRVVASVVDATGNAVGGLQPDDVEVRESGIRQAATARLTSLVAPIALALVIDTSGSMAGQPLVDAKTAITRMIRELRPLDAVAIIDFNATVRIAQPLTTDKASALAAVEALVAIGNTAIYDGAVAGADVLAGADPSARRAIVLLTDGVDNASRTGRQPAVSRLVRSGLPLYAIGLGNTLDRSTLEALAGAAPGGAFFTAPTSAQLVGIYSALSRQLLTEFSVEYRSSATSARDGSQVEFELTLVRGGVVVARTSGAFVVPAGRGARPDSVATPAPVTATVSDPIAAGTDADRTWVVSLLGAATALTLVLWVHDLTLYLGAGPRRRLKTYLRDATVEADESAPAPQLIARLVALLRRIGRPFLRFLPSAYLVGTRHRLELAGEPLTLTEFIGLRWAATAGVAALLAGVVFALSHDRNGFLIALVFGVPIGFMLPGVVLGFMARGRKKAIQRALVPSLDMLALSTEAGLAFDGAISQVVQRWRNPFSDELRRLLLEFQMGRDRKQALRELARRTDLQDVVRFVNAVIQADTLGVGLAKVLQDQALELRAKRRQRAEELARVAPIKMMFPMVLLIFPALFVVILGPAVPKLLAIFEMAR